MSVSKIERWTDEQMAFLVQTTDKRSQPNDRKEWKAIAKIVSKKFGVKRTDKACCRRYSRMKYEKWDFRSVKKLNFQDIFSIRSLLDKTEEEGAIKKKRFAYIANITRIHPRVVRYVERNWSKLVIKKLLED